MTETLPMLAPSERVASWPIVRAAILRDAGEARRPKIGLMACPRCQGGDLYYCIERDGTISAACDTEACVHVEPPSATVTPRLPMSWSARSAPKEES